MLNVLMVSHPQIPPSEKGRSLLVFLKEKSKYDEVQQRPVASSGSKLGNSLRHRRILVCEGVQLF